MSVTRFITIFLLLLLSLFVFLSPFPPQLFAQDNNALFITKLDSSSYDLGQSVNLEILVNTAGQTVNTITIHLQYPSDQLKFTRSDFSNSLFPGIVERDETTPGILKYTVFTVSGYSGTAGNILNLEFEAIAPGEARMQFLLSSAIFLAGGDGKNITGNLKPFSINVTSQISQAPAQSSPLPSEEANPSLIDYTQLEVDAEKAPGASPMTSVFSQPIFPLAIIVLLVLFLILIAIIFIAIKIRKK